MYAFKMRLVFILYLNIKEISQTEFKFMGVGMLNTEVLAKQLFWVLKDRQLSLKISISKRTIKHLLFSKFGCVVVRFLANTAKKHH